MAGTLPSSVGTQTTDKRGFTTKRGADLYAASVAVSKSRGEYINPADGRVTVGVLGEAWLASRAHLKPSTRAVYQSAWRLYVEPRWGNVEVGRVLHSEVQTWLVKLTEGVDDKPKSATTVRRCYDILAGILDVAVKDRLVSVNRARGVSLLRKVGREHVYLTHEQVNDLITVCGEHGLLIALIAYTGLRWGETSGLRVRDLDMLRRRIRVVQNAVLVDGVIIVGTPKTHQRREVPFPRFLDPPVGVTMQGQNP